MSLHTLTIGQLHPCLNLAIRRQQRQGLHHRPAAHIGRRGATVFLRLVAFSVSAGAALLALDAGDAVAVAGELKLTAWVDREGNARPSADLVVGQVLTPYAAKKKRAAVAAAGAAGAERNPAPSPQPQAAESGFGGEDEAWLRGEQR